MLYLLDTNICIYLMKRKPLSYFEKLEQLQQSNEIVTSSIVLAELQYGVANSQQKQQSQINLNSLLRKLIVLPYIEQYAYFYGEIRTDLRRRGCKIGNNDLLIASHALAEKAILVTNNVGEFSRIEGLNIDNWGE